MNEGCKLLDFRGAEVLLLLEPSLQLVYLAGTRRQRDAIVSGLWVRWLLVETLARTIVV